MAKSKASKAPPSKAGAPKGSPGKPGKRTHSPAGKSAAKSEQLTLDAGADAAEAPAETSAPAQAAPAPSRKPAAEGERVVELVIGAKGTYKRLASGKKVQLDDQAWQLELARMLAKKAQPDSASDDGSERS